MTAFTYLSAIILGAAILYPIVYFVGIIAASDYYLEFPYPSVYTFFTVAGPVVFFSVLAGYLLSLLAGQQKLPYLVGYLSAVFAFILMAQPWKEAFPGFVIGWSAHWDVYLYYLALPVAGLLMANKAKQPGTR